MMRLAAILLALTVSLWPALALSPSEMLEDPALEARARALDHQLRCVKCQSESIASSNADWAQDARRAVREQIAAGASDAEVIAFFHERYGDFVLMKPGTDGANVLLWIAGPAMLVLAGGIAIGYVLRRRKAPATTETALSADDEARLKELLGD